MVFARASYSWDFGDGAGAIGRGNAYDGTDPSAAPDHYAITHAYRDVGTFQVTVVQHWDVRSTIPTLPDAELNIVAPDTPSTTAFTVIPSDPVNLAPAGAN